MEFDLSSLKSGEDTNQKYDNGDPILIGDAVSRISKEGYAVVLGTVRIGSFIRVKICKVKDEKMSRSIRNVGVTNLRWCYTPPKGLYLTGLLFSEELRDFMEDMTHFVDHI